MNKLPEKWYIETKYPEVIKYFNELEPKSKTWSSYDGKLYTYYGCDNNTTYIGGANAWRSNPNNYEKVKHITIEEFRLATGKDEIINTYPIY